MTAHFFYLIRCTVRNGVLRQVRRLRNPRYAIAALVGLAYFFFVFGGYRIGEEAPRAGPDLVAVGQSIGPIFLGVLASWWWLWGGHKHGIALMPWERDLLVTAPVTRRQLVQLKIMQAQISIVISALVTSAVMRGVPIAWPLRFLSAWVLFATLHQHQIAASLVHAAAEEQGRRGVRRHLIPLILFSAAFLALAVSLVRAIIDMRAAGSLDIVRERLAALLVEPGVVLALAPFRAVLAPTLATDMSAWLQSFAIAALVLAAHYLWLQRTDAAFEETAAEAGARVSEAASTLRKGGLAGLRFSKEHRAKKLAKPWLPIEPQGTPAYAVFWKNVVYGQRAVRPLVLILALLPLMAVIGIGSMMAGSDEPATLMLGILCLVLAALYTVGGPLAMRHDLRADLRNIDLLRTYPLKGGDLVAAEIAGSTFLITLPQLILGIVGLLLLVSAGTLEPAPAALLLVGGVLVMPIINAVLVTIQNAIALLFPAWTRVGDDQPGGMESMGQNVLTLLATGILFLLSLIPPLIVGAAVAGPLYLQFSEWAAIPGALIVVGALAAETWLFVLWLGRLYDTTDPVEAGLLK